VPALAASGSSLYAGVMLNDEPSRLWTLRRDGHELTCRARLESSGVEIDLLRDGALAVTRSFETGEEALAWADERRARREAEGWRSDMSDDGAPPAG